MDKYTRTLRKVLSERDMEDGMGLSTVDKFGSKSDRKPLQLGHPATKYFKGPSRGMGMDKSAHTVRKGDKLLKYHPELEATKPQFIKNITKKTEAAPGTRFYLTRHRADQFSQYYKMDLVRVASGESSLSNSADNLHLKYDKDKNLFYVVRASD